MAARATGTRTRVLAVALQLANARGFDRMTTAEIAAGANINEGNLYYHFRRKADIAQALFSVFAGEMLRVAEQPLSDPADPECYAAYQRGWFRLMWDFRTFYRDVAAFRAMAPDLRAELQAMNARGQAAVAQVFRQMRAHGMMRATDAAIETLVANIWIVSSYWMEFRGVDPEPAMRPADLAWGFRQVMALYVPFLTVSGQRIAGAAADLRLP